MKNNVNGYSTTYQGSNAKLLNTKVGLMYVSDYMYAATPVKWNLLSYLDNGSTETNSYYNSITHDFLYNNDVEWFISPRNNNSSYAWYKYANPSNQVDWYYGGVSGSGFEIRPTFYLSSDIEIDTNATSADGSASHPYILKAE